MPTPKPNSSGRPPMDWQRLAALALAAPVLAWQAWVLLPPHQQALARMRAARMAGSAARAAGRYAGRQGLAEEAHGRASTAAGWYLAAAWLTGTAAERAAGLYEAARDGA